MRVRILDSPEAWVRMLWAVTVAAGLPTAGAIVFQRPFEVWHAACLAICSAVGVTGLVFLVGWRRRPGRRPQPYIDPGRYQVHALRPAGQRVIIVTGSAHRFGEPGFTLYSLPRKWFNQDPMAFFGVTNVVMVAKEEPSGLRINLSREQANFRVIATNDHGDSA